jgi:AraC-like DNA-binding protein
VSLTPDQQREFLRTFHAMRRELTALRTDARDLLRARLYELLVLVNRWYRDRHGDVESKRHSTVDRFTAMVERDFRDRHRVQDYAGRLDVSPGHLNVLCKQHLGCSAGDTIQRRLMIEAARLLRYTDKPAFVIARELGFADASYFGRFVRRNTGATPRHYRNSG